MALGPPTQRTPWRGAQNFVRLRWALDHNQEESLAPSQGVSTNICWYDQGRNGGSRWWVNPEVVARCRDSLANRHNLADAADVFWRDSANWVEHPTPSSLITPFISVS